MTGGSQQRLTLASESPQRREMLEALGVDFVVRPAGIAEQEVGEPLAVAQANARAKALAVKGEFVLGVDTLVSVGDKILGKPQDGRQAREHLTLLAGREHRVVGGLALVRGGELHVAVEVTRIEFRELSSATIDWYVDCEEWHGRAGGYAIQGRGRALVRRIEGDHNNVVGLPVARLLDLAPELLPGLSGSAQDGNVPKGR